MPRPSVAARHGTQQRGSRLTKNQVLSIHETEAVDTLLQQPKQPRQQCNQTIKRFPSGLLLQGASSHKTPARLRRTLQPHGARRRELTAAQKCSTCSRYWRVEAWPQLMTCTQLKGVRQAGQQQVKQCICERCCSLGNKGKPATRPPSSPINPSRNISPLFPLSLRTPFLR